MAPVWGPCVASIPAARGAPAPAPSPQRRGLPGSALSSAPFSMEARGAGLLGRGPRQVLCHRGGGPHLDPFLRARGWGGGLVTVLGCSRKRGEAAGPARRGRSCSCWPESSLLSRPLPFSQDSREPGSCRVRTGGNTPAYLEADASELAVPGGRRFGTGSPWLELPAEGKRPGATARGQGDLQCPHCLRYFSDEQGEELFRHGAECCQ